MKNDNSCIFYLILLIIIDMLNKSKSYYSIALFLKQNNIPKKDLEKDFVYGEMIKCVGKENLFFCNWTSMSMHNDPTKIRLRNDNFLKLSKKEKLMKTFILFSIIKIENKKLYFVLSSNYFTNYSFSINSSNSFINKDISDLKKWVNEENKIRYWERNIKNKGKQPIYLFWTGTNINQNYESLITYLTTLSKIKSTNYAIFNKKEIHFSLSKTNKDIVNTKYDNLCALLKNYKCLTIPHSNKHTYKEFHHIVPKEWFIENKIFNKDIINDPNNIILLCKKCHIKQRSDPKYLEYVIDSIKKHNLYSDFINYLYNKVNITLPILYKIYGLSYE